MALSIIPMILQALQAAATLAPSIEGLVPIVQKGFAVASGTDSFNDTDLAALRAVSDSIDAAVEARIAALAADPPAA